MKQALAERRSDDAAGARIPQPAYDLIELLFFAYRDFVADPDRILTGFAFGRAHHRVLHFVSRQPGLTIAELLDILRITKQSLNRVLKELVDKGFVEQRAGVHDRRQRLLFPTPKGCELALSLADLQGERIARALAECGPDAHEAAQRFLAAMIDPAARGHVARLVWGNGKAPPGLAQGHAPGHAPGHGPGHAGGHATGHAAGAPGLASQGLAR